MDGLRLCLDWAKTRRKFNVARACLAESLPCCPFRSKQGTCYPASRALPKRYIGFIASHIDERDLTFVVSDGQLSDIRQLNLGISCQTEKLPPTLEEQMTPIVIKRSIMVAGHKTSITLEDAFWDSLKRIASARNLTLSGLVSRVDAKRQGGNLSSAVRLFVLNYYQGQDGLHQPSLRESERMVATFRARRDASGDN